MNEERGMVKWAPYKSLTEQEKALREMQRRKQKKDKPLISSDEAEAINQILTAYNGEMLLIRYYENGFVKEMESQIKKIDPIEKTIKTESKTIQLKSIVGVCVLEK